MAAIISKAVVLTTGGAAGMGLACGRGLQRLGYRIAALDIDGETLDRAWPSAEDGEVLKLAADISDHQSVMNALAKVQSKFGRLDALINNAALHGPKWKKPPSTFSVEEWTQLFKVNVFGMANVTNAATPALSASKGVVVNMSSMVGYGVGSSAYAVSKSAVNGLTTSQAVELGAHGIRVVGVAPGYIDTPHVSGGIPASALQQVMDRQALPMNGQVDDIARVIEFLISPAARMITGTTIIADAGLTRRP